MLISGSHLKDETIKIYIRSNKINCTGYATLQLKVHIRMLHSCSSSTSPMADLRRLFNSIELTADVEIVSETSRSVRCHGVVMCLRSPVFAVMFSRNILESIFNRIDSYVEQHII